MTGPSYVAHPEPERRLVRFNGPQGPFKADLVRGALSQDLCRALRSLAAPHMLSRVRRTFYALIPDEYLGQRNRRGADRRVLVIQEIMPDGRRREAASLRFRPPAGVATPISGHFEKTLKDLFKLTEKEQTDGLERSQERPDASRQAQHPRKGNGAVRGKRAVRAGRGRQPQKGLKGKPGRPRVPGKFQRDLAKRIAAREAKAAEA